MILAIIGTHEINGLNEGMTMINNEYSIERIIRLARDNGIEKVICMLDSGRNKLREFLSSENFGIPVKVLANYSISTLQSLFIMAPLLKDSPFCLTSPESFLPEDDFAEFIGYSLIHTEIDGAVAVTNQRDHNHTLSVAMNQENTIIKFSDTHEGYYWGTAGICSLNPGIFEELKLPHGTKAGKFGNYLRLLLDKGYILKGFSVSQGNCGS